MAVENGAGPTHLRISILPDAFASVIILAEVWDVSLTYGDIAQSPT